MQRPDYRAGRQERAVKIYTVCDESRFLVVRNVPALGCIDDLVKLFGLYGDIEEYRLLDEEDCEPFTDVYWIKYTKYSNSRFAKRKLDNYKFLGNSLEVSYAPHYETLTDTKNKLEERRRAVLNRIQANQGTRGTPHVDLSVSQSKDPLLGYVPGAQQYPPFPLECLPWNSGGKGVDAADILQTTLPMQGTTLEDCQSHEYFPSASMNATVQLVREKLTRISDMPLVHVAEVGEVDRKEPCTGVETNRKRPILEDDLPLIGKKRQDNRRRI